MQVSNGTGQGSEYRVGTNSGGNMLQLISAPNSAPKEVEPMTYAGGMLQPGESKLCRADEAVHVEFLVDRNVVASAWFVKDPGKVMLVEKGGVFSIAVLGEDSVAA